MKKLSLLIVGIFLIVQIKAQLNSNHRPINNEQNLVFVENKGQISNQYFQPRPDILFSSEVSNMTYHLRVDGLSYQLYRNVSLGMSSIESDNSSSYSANQSRKSQNSKIAYHRIDLNWKGFNSNFTIEKNKRTDEYLNYYLNHTVEGIINVPTFKEIVYKNVYTNIDLKYYQKQSHLEYDFIVAPGGDYREIRWEISGAKEIYINDEKNLVIETSLGTIIENAPHVYQENDVINSSWLVEGNTIGFKIGSYDSSKTLIIDPIVRLWATYYGGTLYDRAFDVKVDLNSDVYMAGSAESTSGIATSGSHQDTFLMFSTTNAYIVKFDSSGTRLWATYFAGTDGNSLAIDDSSNLYLTGSVVFTSTQGIATPGCHQSILGGNTDAYLTKFDKNGIRIWGTYYGGNNFETGNYCFLDKSQNIFLVGNTSSTSNIATPGSHQPIKSGSINSDNAFIVKFDKSGNRLWATYYGGPNGDNGNSGAADDSGYVYLLGTAWSSSNISTPGSHQAVKGVSTDAFIAKFDSNGTRVWATYYGGPGGDRSNQIAFDANYNFYFCGRTSSSSNIATQGIHQSNIGGNNDAFLVKMDRNGNRIWATYMGGSSDEDPTSLTISNNNVFIAGWSFSVNGIATYNGYQTTLPGGGAFLVKFNDSGIRQWGTYYGPFRSYGVSTDNAKNVYLIAYWNIPGYATPGSHQPTLAGNFDALLVKFKDCRFDSLSISVNACFRYTSPSGLYNWAESGIYYDTLVNAEGCDSIIKINLTIDTVDVFINQKGIKLTASANPANYQWINCDNGQAIFGAINRSFTATSNGRYAVVITQNSCIDTSLCYSIDSIGVGDGVKSNDVINSIEVYPNPTSSEFYVSIDNSIHVYSINVWNEAGQIVLTQRIKSTSKTRISLPESNGIYIVEVLLESGESKRFSLIKK